jgi:hypothetical protein
MNANGFFNRLEILLYSSLTSAMSGINDLRARLPHSTAIPAQPLSDVEAEPPQVNLAAIESTFALSWNSIKEALLPLVLWLILGFATGFLIGMISPR